MLICGIDEVGRGPLAGPVTTCAIIFEEGILIDGVKDSKKVTPKKREKLYDEIHSRCVDVAVAHAEVDVIDSINILHATMKAIAECINKLSVKPDIYLIDGTYFRLPDEQHKSLNYKVIENGDETEFTISAASIIAKVTRDRLMQEYHVKYPLYNFGKHKGYGTKEHMDLIRLHGLCEIHRRSFCKKFDC